jgi:hypothetical protein
MQDSEYTLKDGIYLWKDGTASICPKTNPIPVPRQVKSNIQRFDNSQSEVVLDFKRFSCTLKCPFFSAEIDIQNKTAKATLKCMETPMIIDKMLIVMSSDSLPKKEVKLTPHKS